MTVDGNHFVVICGFVFLVMAYFSLNSGFICFLSRVSWLNLFPSSTESIASAFCLAFCCYGCCCRTWIFLGCLNHRKLYFLLQLWKEILLGTLGSHDLLELRVYDSRIFWFSEFPLRTWVLFWWIFPCLWLTFFSCSSFSSFCSVLTMQCHGMFLFSSF